MNRFSNRLKTSNAARALLLSVLLAPAVAQALSDDSDQPIRIKADTAELNDATGVSTYRGSVEVTQGSILLKAATVEIVAPGKEVQRIIADGNLATFSQQTDDGTRLYGESEHLEFDVGTDKLVLTRRAKLLEGENSFNSDHIEYDRKARVVEAGNADGGSRVDMTIVPSKKPGKRDNPQ